MSKQVHETSNDSLDGEEILITVASGQKWTKQPPTKADSHQDVASVAIESSCVLELDNKSGCQSIELKATVDATLPAVEFLSLDDTSPGVATSTEPQDTLAINLLALKKSLLRLSALIIQLFVHTVHVFFVGAKESVGGIVHIIKADIQAVLSISLLMEKQSAGSRLPKPNIPRAFTPWRGQKKSSPKKRPLISAPIGPVLHNGNILPGVPASSTVNTLCPKAPASIKTSYTTAYPEQPESQKENVIPTTSTNNSSRHRLTKSRTFNVLSSITHSISRASLASSRTASRNFSAASRASSVTSTNTKLSNKTGSPLEAAAAESQGSSPPPPPPPTNPRFVTEAKPSAYWTGRFLALHDRFHSELLTPGNLRTLMSAHAEGAIKPTKQREHLGPPGARLNATTTRLPPSATSAAILHQPSPSGANRTPARQDAELLTDDDIRCRRIFIHLEAMCLTDAARQSLHAWQQTYARDTGREALLPHGGRMENSRASLMDRIFAGKPRGGKRISIN